MRQSGRGAFLALLVLSAISGCRPGAVSGPRPSFLLVVLDTVRYDVVSAYGQIAGTTPTVDALAAGGLLYRHAYSNANWTLPSHVTLFTGLLPSEHGVGHARPQVPDELVTLAELLRDAGYETVGISENPWIVEEQNVAQGFERFTSLERGMIKGSIDVGRAVGAWLAGRRRHRPFLLFVNLMDAHAPYKIRQENPFLRVDPAIALATPQDEHYLCTSASHSPEMDVLRALYADSVAIADARLGQLLAQLRDAGAADRLVTLVTSDHGEHLGEHRLIHHEYGVYEELLHVPLVVHGLPDVSPGLIETPVQLADVMPSLLTWAGATVPKGRAGRPLPTADRWFVWPRTLIAENIEPKDVGGDDPMPRRFAAMRQEVRRACTPADRVDGTMRAAIRYPFKLVAYENYPSRLYDLSQDPRETEDRTAGHSWRAAALARNVQRMILAARPPERRVARPRQADPARLERLRALGYLDGGGPAR